MSAPPPLAAFLEQVHDQLFAEFPLWQDASGHARGRVFKNELSSIWLPVRNQSGHLVGHAGVTCATDSAGKVVPVEALFRLVRDDGLVRLDRFCRTLHVLNRPHGTLPLFLDIHPLLPRSVSTEHGQVFLPILDFLGIQPAQVIITLPPAVVQDPSLLGRVSRNYRNHGYGLAWSGRQGQEQPPPSERPDWWIRPHATYWHASADDNSDF